MNRILIPSKGEATLSIQDCRWLAEQGCPETAVRMHHDLSHLYLRFRVLESDPRITCTRLNEPVYTDSCVEFFVQPVPGPDAAYLNFEMNAAGVLLLGKGTQRENRRLLAETEMEGIIITPGHDLDEAGHAMFWRIDLTISFKWLMAQVPGFVPAAGAILGANFYKCGDLTPVPHYGSWNPMTAPVPDFHRPMDFGELVLE